jgi:hypothetical protein
MRLPGTASGRTRQTGASGELPAAPASRVSAASGPCQHRKADVYRKPRTAIGTGEAAASIERKRAPTAIRRAGLGLLVASPAAWRSPSFRRRRAVHDERRNLSPDSAKRGGACTSSRRFRGIGHCPKRAVDLGSRGTTASRSMPVRPPSASAETAGRDCRRSSPPALPPRSPRLHSAGTSRLLCWQRSSTPSPASTRSPSRRPARRGSRSSCRERRVRSGLTIRSTRDRRSTRKAT